MKKPPYRTLVAVLALAAMGGVALILSKGSFGDYASVLKMLGWAIAVKSGFEHATSRAAQPEPPK